MPLSIRDMAAQLGVSKSQVSRDKLAGMPMGDAAAARAWRDANNDVSRTVEGRIDRPGVGPDTSAAAVGGLATTAGAGGAGASPASSAEPDDAPTDQASAEYRQDRARNERIRADLAQLELDKAKGRLIDATEAARMAFTAFRSLRDQAFNTAARLAPQLAAETDVLRIEQLIDAELATVFGQFDEARLLREPEDDDDDAG